VDRYHHFEYEPVPASDLHPDAIAAHKRITEEAAKILYRGTDKVKS
jgi:non-heme Fe2+,alpha-ketoglutarate-dependent halogenase